VDDYREARKVGVEQLEKLLKSKKMSWLPQNLDRHRAVLGFMKYQLSRRPGETREEMAVSVARYHHRGVYFARKIVYWEGLFLKGEKITEGKRGCHSKTRSWFNDEGVLLAAREWIATAGESKHPIVLFSVKPQNDNTNNLNRSNSVWASKGSWGIP
jgi:hypothetical protein